MDGTPEKEEEGPPQEGGNQVEAGHDEVDRQTAKADG